MSGTYRTVLTYARDGFYDYGNNARKGAAQSKKIDRRQARRQAARAKREAIREYELDVHEDYEEMLSMEREEAGYDSQFWEELEREQFLDDCEMMRLAEERADAEEWERAERYHREMEMLDTSYDYCEWDY